MSEKHLNIVAFDVPDPPNYGGAIDIFYRIKALSEVGVQIQLHVFEYGRGRSEILEKYCASVTYYSRKRNPKYTLSNDPFIVESRRDIALLKNLVSNRFPILFEGLHTTAFLSHPDLHNRLKLVRTHNIEHEYYRNLSMAESKTWKRFFFKREAAKLKKYECVLESADHILAISDTDMAHFSKKFGNTIKLNPFHPLGEISISTKRQGYAFYHGNFTVSENRVALRFLVKEVFSQIDIPLVIAGKGATKALERIPKSTAAISTFNDPSANRMREIAQLASVHVLPAFQASGFKIKLLYSLYTSPFVIVNPQMVAGTDLSHFCEIVDSPDAMAAKVVELSRADIVAADMQKRGEYLAKAYSNQQNALKIKELLG